MRLRNLFLETGKHYLVYGVGLAATRLAAFLLVPVYTRVFSVQEYGVFTILAVTLTFVSGASQLGVASATLRSYFDYDSDKARARLVGSALVLILSSTSAVALAMGLASQNLSRLITGSPQYTICIWLLGLTLLTDSVFFLYTCLLRAAKNSMAFSIANLSKLLVTCVSAIVLVVVLKQGIVGAIAASALSSAVVSIAILPWLISRSSFHFDRVEARKLLSFGVPLAPMGIASSVLASADRYFLMNMSGSIEVGKAVVGVYGLIYTFANLFRIVIVEPLSMVWLPQALAEKESPRAGEFYSRTFSLYILFSGFIALCMTMAYRHVIWVVSGPKYVGPTVVVWLILVSLVLTGTTRVLGIGIMLARKTGYSAVIFGFAAALNLGLNFWFVPHYGMLGAAIATVIGAAILPVSYYYAGDRYCRVRYQWRPICANIGLFLGLSGCYFAGQTLNLTAAGRGGLELALAVAYFPLVIALRVIRIPEMKQVFSRTQPTPIESSDAAEEAIPAN